MKDKNVKDKKKKKSILAQMASAVKHTFLGKVAFGIFIAAIIGLFSGKLSELMFFFLEFVAVILWSNAIGPDKDNAKKHNAVSKKSVEADEKKILREDATKCVGDYLYVNEKFETFCVPSANYAQYKFSDLLDYEVIDNGEVVVGGSVLGTAVGAMAGGLTGALLGASASKATDWCNELKIKISVNDISTPTVEIPLIKKAALKDSNAYKKAVQTADEIAGVLKVIKARNGR